MGNEPDYRLDPLPEGLRAEDVTFAVLGRLPRDTAAQRALLASLYDQAARIQGPCWQEPPFEWVPPHCLQALDAIGGATLAAWVELEGRPRLVGMASEMPAFEREGDVLRPFLYSHLMAVDGPPIGFHLKRLQREDALERGLATIRWTYDPLQSLNANLNIRKCGATCRAYKRGAYDLVGINAGLEADRFYVTWDLASARVRARMEEGPEARAARDRRDRERLDSAFPVNGTILDPVHPGFRVPGGWELDPAAALLAVEIPVNLQAMIDRACDTHARPWREHTRAVFETCFAAGFAVTGFVLAPDEEIPEAQRTFYLLERQP